jgi:hypothetical protein
VLRWRERGRERGREEPGDEGESGGWEAKRESGRRRAPSAVAFGEE